MNRLFRKEIQTASKCKHIQSQRKANNNQRENCLKKLWHIICNVKLSLTSLNPGSQILVLYKIYLSSFLSIPASCVISQFRSGQRGSGFSHIQDGLGKQSKEKMKEEGTV